MTFPTVNTGTVRLGGTVIPAALDVGSGFVYGALCGAGGGTAPREFGAHFAPTEHSIVAINNGSSNTLNLVGSFFPALIGSTPGPMHCGLLSLSAAPANLPTFIFLGIGPTVVYTAVHPVTLAFSAGVAWTNEIGIGPADARLVDVPWGAPDAGGGPTLVMRGPGVLPGQDSLFVRLVTPMNTTFPATRVAADLRPAGHFIVDLSRMHAVAHADQTITVYYRIHDDGAGFDGTAVISISGIDGSVRTRPAVCLGGYVPVVSTGGALRHPVTSEIVAAFEPAGFTPYKQICFFASRGLGLVFDPVPLVWNGVTHPHIFGGRWARAAPDQQIHVVGMGWADHRSGSSFRVYLGHRTGLIDPLFRDFENTYRSSHGNYAEAKRLLVGEIAVTRTEGENGPASTFRWMSTNTSRLHTREELRRGFPKELGIVDPVLYCPFDTILGTDVVSEIGPHGSLTNTVPAIGYVGQSRYIGSSSDVITFADDGTLSTDFLTIVGFIYPVQSSSGTTIVSKGDSWSLRWSGPGSRIRFSIRNASNTPFVVQTTATPIERYYHVAATYDGRYARIYVWGVLISEVDTGVSSTLLQSDDDVVFSTVDDYFGRVDDFALAGEAASHQDILTMITHTVASRSGEPIANSRRPGRPDSVLSVASCTADDGSTITIAARGVRLVMQTSYYTQSLFFDVWQRKIGSDPVFLGSFPAPPETNDVFHTDYGYGHSPLPVSGLPMRIFRTETGYEFFVALRLVNNALDLYQYSFTSSFDPVDFTTKLITHSNGALYRWEALDVVQDPVHPERFWKLLSVVDTGTYANVLYVFRPGSWSEYSISMAYFIDVGELLPPAGNSLDWASSAIVTGGRTVFVSGIVGRIVYASTGLPIGTAGCLQLVYSIRTPGGTTARAVDLATLTTVLAPIPHDHSTTPVAAEILIPPIQLDELGRGGTPPVRPLRWLQPPEGREGESLLLGVCGPRGAYPSSVTSGDGGMTIYHLRREGTWGIRAAFPIPFQAFVSSWDIEALADVSYNIDDSAPYQYTLAISRPFPDASDKVSSTVISSSEATAGVYGLASPLATDNAVVRVVTAQNAVVWTDHLLDIRTFSHEKTGPRYSEGKHHRALAIVRWSTPADPLATYDSSSFADYRIPALQGGCYSNANRLARFFSLDDDMQLVPMLGSKQFRLEGSGHLAAAQQPLLGPVRGIDRVASVGIVDQGGFGRYVFFRFENDSIVELCSFDSPHDNELDGTLEPAVLWIPPGALAADVWRRSRVVVCGGTLYLYTFIGEDRSDVHFLRLPGPGEPATVEAPRPVAALHTVVDDRVYALATEKNRVALYFGDADDAGAFRTLALVHDPNVWALGDSSHPMGSVVRSVRNIPGASPFPCAYAATKGSDRDGLTQTFLLLEPMRSRHDGGRQSRSRDPLLGEHSGSAWELVVFANEGMLELERIPFDAKNVTPFMGGSHAGAAGGRALVRTRPTMLARVVDDEAESVEYVLHLAVKDTSVYGNAPPPSDFRYDASLLPQNNVGDNVVVSRGSAETLNPVSVPEKGRWAHLVPGSLLIEPLGGTMDSRGDYYAGGNTVANPIGAWDLGFGYQNNGSNVSQDQIHGVKCFAHAPNRLFIVGWFVVGE